MKLSDIAIVSAGRTATGSFGGSLATLSAVEIGVACAKGIIERAGISPSDIDEVLLGNVLHAGCGQNVARQVQLGAGIPETSTATTISKVCGAGLKAIALGAQAIWAGDKEVVLAGGTESMSNAPFVIDSVRWGKKLGNTETIDTLLKDGLTDAFNNIHMGITAENLAEIFDITREQQDQFALESQTRAMDAQTSGYFKDEIIPIEIQTPKKTVVFDKDEYIRPETTLDALQKLRPAFKKDGTVTAGNASGINDGAAMVLLMTVEKAEAMGLVPLAIITSYASAGVDPATMGYGPVPATVKALQKAGLELADIDLVECNEAFAAQSLSVMKELGLDPEITNVNGGAIALGHPIGASGARILVTLLHEMLRRKSKTGLATLCIGGGMGISMIINTPSK